MESVVSVHPLPTSASARPESRALLGVVFVGVVVAALTWRTTDAGLGWVATDVVLVLAIVLGVARGRPGNAAWLFAGVSSWLAGMTVWRASDWAILTALPGSFFALVALALTAARRTEARRVAEVGGASIHALRAIPSGIVDAARMPSRAVGTGSRHHAASIAKGALLGAPLAGLFTLLLSADAGFRAALGKILVGSGDGLELVLFSVATTVGLLVAYAVLGRVESAGEARRASPAPVVLGPYRVEGDAPAPVAVRAAADPGPRVRPLTWAIVLGQVMAVFGVYVLANVRSLFEGHSYLRAAGTGTYAGYLHTGFLQVSMATFLAVACVVGGHLVLRPRAGAARVAGGAGLVAIELGLLALVGLTLASSAHRLALYEEAYGYTYERLGVFLLELGIGGLLTLTAARCVARGSAAWTSALAWSAVLFTVVSGSVDADGWIARRNVARARAGAPLDVEYLADLSEDARVALPDVVARDPSIASYLEARWSDQQREHGRHGWRSMRGLGAR